MRPRNESEPVWLVLLLRVCYDVMPNMAMDAVNSKRFGCCSIPVSRLHNFFAPHTNTFHWLRRPFRTCSSIRWICLTVPFDFLSVTRPTFLSLSLMPTHCQRKMSHSWNRAAFCALFAQSKPKSIKKSFSSVTKAIESKNSVRQETQNRSTARILATGFCCCCYCSPWTNTQHKCPVPSRLHTRCYAPGEVRSGWRAHMSHGEWENATPQLPLPLFLFLSILFPTTPSKRFCSSLVFSL